MFSLTPQGRRLVLLSTAAIVGLFVSLPRASADAVPLGDASFEGNSNSPGTWTSNLDPEWKETDGPGNGNALEEYAVGFVAQGNDHLAMQSGHDVWQDLGVTYQADTRYTLTVAVGNRPGSTNAGNLSTYSLADSFGLVHETASFDASTIAAGTFVDAPGLELDTTANPSVLGRTIRVLLQARGSGRSHFDHIRLEATSTQVPGAATVALFPATGISSGAATLNGEVTGIGDAAPVVTFFYGTRDGGLDPASWDASVSLAGTQSAAFSAPVADLTPATCYFVAVRATNSAGSSWTVPPGTFETLPLPPTVVNLAAGAVTATTAGLGAEVTDTGGDNPLVTIHFGEGDGGTAPGNWDRSVSLGSVSGQASAMVTGLAPGTPHYFRAYAQNGAGGSWAPASATFTTGVVSLPIVSNRNAKGITGTTATLRGEVDSTGGDVPVVTVFYGPADGGTTEGAWAESVVLGRQAGNVSLFAPGLAPRTTYWFRCRATNVLGEVWAANSDFFTTTSLVPAGVVINEIHYDPRDESIPGEFIELHNPGDTTLDLSGWKLTDAVDYSFPPGTAMAPGDYLVVAEDPATILAVHGVTALGPWLGRLNNDGEEIDLRDDDGALQDQVSYGAGFPWPSGPRGGGGSAELIHPSLDNNLGGSWRTSLAGDVVPNATLVARDDPGWHYRKGTGEASAPINAWRFPGFVEDTSWLTGQTPLGYGDGDDHTLLTDMPDNYSTVYLRHEFTLAPNAIPGALTLRVYVDDGAVVWINGNEVARLHAPGGELAYDANASNHEAGWEEVSVSNARNFLVGGTNVLAVHALNESIGGSSDFSIDAELIQEASADLQEPSPGAVNAVFSESAPPQVRQVSHHPESPRPGEPVRIAAKITDPDGVGPVTLSYQLVDPGAYIRKTDEAYATGWTSVPMVDDGSGGDFAAGDFEYTAVLPGNLQTHRRLVRYRISFEDGNGQQASVPWPDDEQPNFAYFVHGGVPPWTGSFTPGETTSTFTPELMDSLATYHLVANETDVINSQYSAGSDGVHMLGTLVYDGVVYDHIEFENRGESSTYISGKNKWRFHFNRARSFQARDNLGKRYDSDWNRMNFEGCSCPWAAVNRGMAGVEEALSYRLYALCGVPSPRTHYVHFRVVDDALETDPASQYEGDLWGLYLAVEQPDGSFLNDRGLPDGNVYKIEGGNGDKKAQGTGQPVDSSDWGAFSSVSGGTRTEAWWRANMDMDAYYSMRACNRICGNVDIRVGSNHYFYHHPDGHWVPMPWDLDMMFIAETHGDGHILQQNALNNAGLALEFRNRARELLDLMCSDAAPGGGQIGQLIDEYAQIVNPSGLEETWADLDACMWNHHPRTNGNPGTHSGQSSHKGNFYHTPYTDSRDGGAWTRTLASSDHEGSMGFLLDYATDTFTGGTWAVGNGNQFGYGYEFLKQEAADAAIPVQPVASFTGTPGFPVSDLVFTTSDFADPQGAGTFGAVRWRLAEIANPGTPGFLPGDPRKYEVETVWDSGELATFSGTMQIPVVEVRPGHTYRVRVRHKDNTGCWSHWSDPVEFVAAAADVTLWRDKLVISEFMYHPPEPVGAAELAASTDREDFEFLELQNVSDTLTIDLSNLRFTKGVEFDFGGGAITSLGPGDYVLVVRNVAAFEARYGLGLPVAGEYLGGLANGGEQVKLSFGAGIAIHDFTYNDLAPWPAGADGFGPSLVLIAPEIAPDHALAGSWKASYSAGGTPGASESAAPGSFDAWSEARFSPAQWLDPAVSGPDADPDGDGRPNVLEWALDTSALQADFPVLDLAFLMDGGATYPAIRFHRPEMTLGLTWELLASDDLETWEVVSSTPLTEQALGAGIERAVLRDDQPVRGARRFLRIQVTLAP